MSEAKKTPRPLPRPDIYMKTRPFWEAAKQHKLMLQFCKDTNQYQWFPRPVSIYSGKRNLEWREASGRGTLYTWTNTLVPWPGHEDRVPYICALVDLEERVRILVNLIKLRGLGVERGASREALLGKAQRRFQRPGVRAGVSRQARQMAADMRQSVCNM
jgi:uncharacterized OB-fold protein